MMLSDICLSDVCLTFVAYMRSADGVCGRTAGWRVLADRADWLKVAAARFRCRPGQGHIVAAARLQLVSDNSPYSRKLAKINKSIQKTQSAQGSCNPKRTEM